MSLRLVLTALLLPPLLLVYVALAGLALGIRRRRARTWLGLAAGALLAVLVLGMPVTSQALLVSLEGGLPLRPPPDAPPQAIVILSAGVERTPDGLEPGPLTLQRLLAGARLWRRTGLPVLVSGGVAHPGETSIASVMARTLEHDFHVPVRWIEGRSRTTWENAADSAAMLRPEGVRSVYLVTHSWHERRSVLVFRRFGLVPTVASVPPDVVTTGVVPSVKGLSRSFYGLHEWIGMLVYSVRAWRAGPEFTESNNAA